LDGYEIRAAVVCGRGCDTKVTIGNEGPRGAASKSLQIAADFAVFRIDFAGETVETGNRDDGDEGSDEGVFDEILARFVMEESAQMLGHELSFSWERVKGLPAGLAGYPGHPY
jgi:hypothetical protein